MLSNIELKKKVEKITNKLQAGLLDEVSAGFSAGVSEVTSSSSSPPPQATTKPNSPTKRLVTRNLVNLLENIFFPPKFIFV